MLLFRQGNVLIRIEETFAGINVGKFGNVVKCVNLDLFTSSSKRFTLWTELHIYMLMSYTNRVVLMGIMHNYIACAWFNF